MALIIHPGEATTGLVSSASNPEDDLYSSESGQSSSTPTKKANHGQCFKIVRKISLEPMFFLFSMGESIVGMVVQTYFIDRICRLTEGFEAEVCNNLTHYAAQEREIEKVVSQFSIYQTLIQTGFPVLLALFLGPLTERIGYKPLVLYSLSGYILYCSLMIGSYFLPYLPPEYLLIASIPLGICGGGVTLMIAAYGYMATQTTVKNRSYRMGAMGAAFELGIVLGYICGSQIYKYGGFLPAFLYIFTCYVLAFLYSVIMVSEVRPETMDVSGTQSILKSAINLESVKSIFVTSFKRRPGQSRTIIMLVTVSTCFIFLAYSCSSSQYLYTRNRFGWDMEQYSEYSAITTLLSGTGSLVVTVLLLKILKVSDINAVAFNIISKLAGYVIFALSNQEWHMYLGSGIQMFGSSSTALLKSILAKCVEKDEYGKVLTFVIICELMLPFISSPLYSLIYINTASIFPSAIYVLAAGCTVLVLFVTMILRSLLPHGNEYILVTETEA